MKKLLKLFFVVSIILIPIFAKAQIFDPEYIISDDDLTNYNSMDKNDIQQFLDSKGILGTMTFVDIFGTSGTAAEIIYNASREFKINPKYILTTLQKEQSLVEGANIEQDDLDWATGFGICDSCSKSDPALQIYKGFANQVYHTARRNREYIDNPNKFSIKVNKPVKIDNVVITPKNQATVNLYLYTPHIQGNMSFFNIWNKYFSKNYPTGTLLQIKGQKEIWLIEGFYRRQVMSLSAVASKYNIKNIIYTTKADLEKYDIGIPVKFANYSLLRDENKNIYMLIDDVIKRISSWNVIKKLGLAQDEIINVKNAELEDYQRGETITEKSIYPTGAILKNKQTKEMWYVYDGIRHKIDTDEILLAKYKGKTIITTDDKEINQYVEGVEATLPDGTLVTSKEYNGPIYVISNGERREIRTQKLFDELGYKKENIQKVSNKTLLAHPLGIPVENTF